MSIFRVRWGLGVIVLVLITVLALVFSYFRSGLGTPTGIADPPSPPIVPQPLASLPDDSSQQEDAALGSDDECTSSSETLTWVSPKETTVIADGDDYLIRFRWDRCNKPIEDQAVIIRIRDASTNSLIAGYVWGFQIKMDSSGRYNQLFRTSEYDLHPGQSLKILVYFGNKLKGTAYLMLD